MVQKRRFTLDIGLPDIDGYALARQLRAMAAARPEPQPAPQPTLAPA